MTYDIIVSGLVSAIVSVIITSIVQLYIHNKTKKLKEIDNQLLNVYLPMYSAIEDYKRTTAQDYLGGQIAESFGLMEDYNKQALPQGSDLDTLDKSLREIEQKNTGILDSHVKSFSIEFSSIPSRQTLDKFLNSVSNKINELKNERQKYL